MKKKFILLILIILTCTGCSIEYNITITDNDIKEVIEVKDYITSNRTKETILNEYNIWYPTYVNYITEGESIEIEDYSYKTEGVEYHQKEIETLNNGYLYTYKHTYPIDKYYDAYTLARTYLETTVQANNNSLILKTGKKNLLCNYNYFDELTVNIIIDSETYKLNYTNSSNINNNKYTWTLNKSNCDDSQIILTLDRISNYDGLNSDKSNNTNVKKNSDYIMYIFYGILIIIILIGYYIFKKMKEKSEKMDLDD